MKTFVAVAILAAVFCCFSFANGQTIVTVSARAYFDRLSGGTGLVGCRPAGDYLAYGGPNQQTCQSYSYPVPPRSQGRWGTPAGSSGKSGLGFEGVFDKQVTIGQPFFLGTLTHFNYPIFDAANATYLNIIFIIKDANNVNLIGNNTYNFLMLINETSNTPPCPFPGVSNCSDKIAFATAFNFQNRFTLGQVEYTLRLDGFRESQSSSSSSVSAFISDEGGQSVAYLFATITAACPSTCVNGGAYIITSNNECRCNCSGVTCPTGQVPQADCSCACPNATICNGGAGGTLRSNCTCACNACNAPRVSDQYCNCRCPDNYCNSGTINNPTTCSCNCPGACTIQNEVRDARCVCQCPLTGNCPAPFVEDPNPNVCQCICANSTCNAGYTINPNTCNCDCTRTCPNGQALNVSSCTCGDCAGDWIKDGQGLCTICGLNQATDCLSTEVLDPTICQCVCQNLTCDLYNNGQVIDTSSRCGCRNCTAADPCFCGNGKVEPGEDCDIGSATDPCCQNCKWTYAPCNDTNECTWRDSCNGTGFCIGEYKCLLPTECNQRTCDPQEGVCRDNFVADQTPCGAGDFCTERCMAGVCVNQPYPCPADNTTSDCWAPMCDSTLRTCLYQPLNNTVCADGNGCTESDTCRDGICEGTPKICPSNGNPCQVPVCRGGNCGFQLLTNVPCNADNSDCTVDDRCVAGECLPGRPVSCTASSECVGSVCNPSSGTCEPYFLSNNTRCNDRNQCTKDDRCNNGTCRGVTDPDQAALPICGGTPPQVDVPPADPQNVIIIFVVTGAAALIAAIVGLAFLIKRIRDSRLLDPDTWNPDMFSSVGANPLYQGSSKVVDNRLYEDRN